MANGVEVSEEAIETAYLGSKNHLSWRLLSSPCDALNGAKVAFIGMNPGGRVIPVHPKFCMKHGSAYVDEQWGTSTIGTHRLQRQVQTLFEKLDVKPAEVLAGNLVPFRSPSWQELKSPTESLQYGKALWREILDKAHPSLVIAMGRDVGDALSDLLKAGNEERVRLGWGEVSGRRSAYANDKTLVTLPHLTRFGVVTRRESQEGLSTLFGPWWHP